MTAASPRQPGNRALGPGYAQALRTIIDGGATWHEVAARVGVGLKCARAMCRGFCVQGLVHVAEWRQVQSGTKRRWTPVYAPGLGQDAAPPVAIREKRSITRAELRGFCDLVKALQMDSWHGKGLAEFLGQSVKPVRRTLRALHELRLVRVDDYMHRARAGRRPPLYAWGIDEADAPKPRRKTAREAWTRSNQLQSARLAQAKLLHGMVRGVNLIVRSRRAGVQQQEVA